MPIGAAVPLCGGTTHLPGEVHLTYDDLFTNRDGGWYEGASAGCRAFIEGLADEVAARGVDPTWAEVRRRILAEFPEDATKTIEPIQRAVRNLIADRG